MRKNKFRFGAVTLVSVCSLYVSCSPPHIRKSVAALTPTEVSTYRAGVAVMKSKPITDKTSWDYQAWIHGTEGVSFNQCQHGTQFFLSWHRMYLYYFERILRKASGDPNFALPYWNYTDPGQRVLPDIFRNPANSTNSLYIPDKPATPGRKATVNAGTYSLPASSVNISTFMPMTNFMSMQSSMEGTPHGDVHVSMGGTMGGYGSAQDPIFWLHHCNIDRLWTCWLAQGEGRAFPTDAAWLDHVFTFYDEDGNAVTMTGRTMLLLNPFNYKYDDEPCTKVKPITIRDIRFARVPVIDTLRLHLRRASIPLPVPPEWRMIMDSVSNGKMSDAMLEFTFSDIRLDKTPELYYEVYLNVDEATLANIQYTDPHYVGNLSFFGVPTTSEKMPGHDMHGRNSISILMYENLAKLIEKREISPERMTLSFVPKSLVDKDGKDILPQESPQVTVGSISLKVARAVK